MLAMERAVLPCIFMLVVFHHFGVRVGVTQSPEASFNDPRCNGEMVCPNTPLLFTCTVTGSLAASARVTLPSGPAVAVTNMNMTEVIDGPLPDGVNISSHNVVGTGPVNYSLTLSIERADILTDMAVICDAQTFTPMTDEATCPVATGQPGLPMNPSQNESANTESSAEIQWQHPVETGGRGISISSYTVNVFDDAGHQILSTSVSGNVSTFNITGLEYNRAYNAEITAINSCGFSSPAATLTVMIKARVPPQPNTSIQMDCSAPVKDERTAMISWVAGQRETNVLYPGEELATVTITPGDICHNGTGSSCNTTINEETTYTVSVTLKNDVGSSMPVNTAFNSTILFVENILLNDDKPLSVTVTLNRRCEMREYSVTVMFGARLKGSNSCNTQQNVHKGPLRPGNTSVFSVPANSVMLESNEEYCYNVSLDGMTVIIGGGGGPDLSPAQTIAVGLVVGIVAAGVVLIFILVMAVVLVFFKLKKKKDGKPSSPAAVELVDSGVTDQDPNTISRAPHPTTGELYTQVDLSSKKKEASQDPSTIEHQEAPGGEMYAMPQKTSKKGKKTKKDDELSEEEKAALYSVPDRKGQKAKSDGLTYAQLDIQSSGKQAPPSQGSTYADIRYNN